MATGGADIEWADFDHELLDAEIEYQLHLKGYCVINLGSEDDSVFEALSDVRSLKAEACFQPPPREVVDGLLGEEGSAAMAWLNETAEAAEEEAAEEGEEGFERPEVKTLLSMYDTMSNIAEASTRFLHSMGYDTLIRTSGFLLQGGTSDFEGPELDEKTCTSWISTFNQARLMMVLFLGPNDATLELHPFSEEEPAVVELEVRPNSLVIFRCDLLSRKLWSSNLDYSLCCFITLPQTQVGPRGWTNRGPPTSMPFVQQLDDWASERMKELYSMELDGMLDESYVPREWVRLMHHHFYKQGRAQVAVRGQSGHLPGQHDSEVVWKAMNVGIDFQDTIPYSRWDHELYYDSDPTSWIRSNLQTGGTIRTAVKHCAFIDGVEYFDNRFFNLSQMEARSMDPMQRHILETSYEGFWDAGLQKQDLSGSYVAVYTGSAHPEWAYVNEHMTEYAITNASQALLSNRISYIMSLKGPSTSIDCEMASSAMGLLMGCKDVSRTAEGEPDCVAACCSGVYFCMTPLLWPRYGAFMNHHGRCFTFDSSANGYVRGECCGSLILRRHTEENDEFCYGTLAGWRMSANGRAASLTAPCGPAEQEACVEAVRHAGISVLDVDGAECHGLGAILADGVEVTSLAHCLRGKSGDENPLLLASTKAHAGAACEACGILQVLRVLFNILYGTNTPAIHLRQLNPHMEISEASLLMHAEPLPYHDQGAFHGVASRGWGGANVNLVLWYSADKCRLGGLEAPRLDLDRQEFSFWPGGGGSLARDSRPSDGYRIVGSWSATGTPEVMERKEGCHSYVVTLGMARYETFQIWIDGEEDRVLHPGIPNAPAGYPVIGPSHVVTSEGLAWRIDGRDLLIGEDEQLVRDDGDGSGDEVKVPSRDSGQPGDQYEVQLLTAGKWRAVTWKKIGSSPVTQELLGGSYFIVGGFNNWTLQEMQPTGEPGVYVAEVGPLRRRGSDFYIIRNRDNDQMFHPAVFTEAKGGEVAGPSDAASCFYSGCSCWQLRPAADSASFRVEFRRLLQEGKESRILSWTQLEGTPQEAVSS